MLTINRTTIVVTPGQRFVNWLHQADVTSADLKLDNLRLEATIYLLPECDSETEARGHLEALCGRIFEEQLDGWYRVPSSWPKRRDFEAFNDWFEWSFHSVIVDLCADSLIEEEMRISQLGLPCRGDEV
jgi:hypothetical protein